jgi:hypothetical protein
MALLDSGATDPVSGLPITLFTSAQNRSPWSAATSPLPTS